MAMVTTASFAKWFFEPQAFKAIQQRPLVLGLFLPVVFFAVERRFSGSAPDYWDHATMLEEAVLENDFAKAKKYLSKAVAAIRETWEHETTARNLMMIERSRKARGEDTS